MEEIQTIISSECLPDNLHTAIPSLFDSNGAFTSQEGTDYDFKSEWPFSYSDSYFGGIARLICALANTRGGLIIFGVHDKNRTAGHNKVPPNVDKLEKALAQLLTARVKPQVRRYPKDAGDVDVLLVSPRPQNTLPVRFAKKLESYAAGIIWVREGHEVISAEPRHIAMLYCRAPSSPSGRRRQIHRR